MLIEKGVRNIFKIKNNDITMTKGDSGCFVIKLKNRDGTEFIPEEGDEVVFSVKEKKYKSEPVVLCKTGTEIIFEGKDTENLGSGSYFYDVFIKCGNGERQTVIEGKYILKRAVHTFE